MKKLWKEIMRTPGPIRVQLLLLLTLTASSVSSTALQISTRVGSTSGESISRNAGSLEVANERLRVKVTGNDTTEALKSLNKMLKSLEDFLSSERSSVSTEQKGG